jgi:hypothetical protein
VREQPEKRFAVWFYFAIRVTWVKAIDGEGIRGNRNPIVALFGVFAGSPRAKTTDEAA